MLSRYPRKRLGILKACSTGGAEASVRCIERGAEYRQRMRRNWWDLQRETQALRSPHLARVGVHEAGLMVGGGKYILNHLYGLSFRAPGPDFGILEMAAKVLYRRALRELQAGGVRKSVQNDLKHAFRNAEPTEATEALAREYPRMVGAVHSHRLLLEEYGIAVDRGDDSSQAQRRAIAETAKRVGLRVPQYEEDSNEPA